MGGGADKIWERPWLAGRQDIHRQERGLILLSLICRLSKAPDFWLFHAIPDCLFSLGWDVQSSETPQSSSGPFSDLSGPYCRIEHKADTRSDPKFGTCHLRMPHWHRQHFSSMQIDEK
jgi:hypothetical protein